MVDINVERDITKKLRVVFKGWVIRSFGRNGGKVYKPTVSTSIKTITKTPENPRTTRTIALTLTLLVPEVDPAKRDEVALDTVVDFLGAIDELPNVRWSTATRGLDAEGTYLGYDIEIEYIYQKEAN